MKNITVYDGYNTTSLVAGTLCGPLNRRRIFMRHNEAFVKLSSEVPMNVTFYVDYVAYTPVEGKTY